MLPLPLPVWPDGAEVAVSLTFDVDSDAVLPAPQRGAPRRLSHESLFRYGITRGLPRLLALLRRRALRATFYVPGETALRYPNAITAIAADGHEIGHHGHHHLAPHEISPARQQDEIDRGLDALVSLLGTTPHGYRAPFAELTPETLRMLLVHGFRYDSSCMGDDRPYVERCGDDAILELPIHWALDDAPYFLCTLDDGGLLREPAEVMRVWRAELAHARLERRHVTYVMHPEVIGRAPQLAAFERFLDELSDAWVATHAEVAALVGAAVAS